MTRLKIKIKKSIAKRRLIACLRRKVKHVSCLKRESEHSKFVSIFSVLTPREIQTILDGSPYFRDAKKHYAKILRDEVLV